ncbi:hypothetical protein HK101_002688 [Irineochytrium annulatum]|nr:hypothetical protein HK101_002688 [Irineochytrium annulatum]
MQTVNKSHLEWDALELARDHAATAIASLQFHLQSSNSAFPVTTAPGGPALYSNASIAPVATTAADEFFNWYNNSSGRTDDGRSAKIARTIGYDQQHAGLITGTAPNASYSFTFHQPAPVNSLAPYLQQASSATLFNMPPELFPVSLATPELLLPKSQIASSHYNPQPHQHQQQQRPYALYVSRSGGSNSPPPHSASSCASSYHATAAPIAFPPAIAPRTHFDTISSAATSPSLSASTLSTPPTTVISLTPPSNPCVSESSTAQVLGADILRTRKSRSRVNASEKEVRCDCRVCGVALGSFHLIGDDTDFDRGFACDLLCGACEAITLPAGTGDREEADKAANMAGMSAKVRRKRKRSERREVECKVCLEVVAFGGCRMLPEAHLPTPAASPLCSPIDAKAVEAQWIEPNFKVEMFCKGCRDEFRFCSSCGGGSTTRSGKWRPKQLFLETRKTCSLPHVRVGSAARFHTVNYRMIHSAGQPVTLDPLLMLGNDMDVIPFADLPAVDAIPALTSAVADHAELHLMQIMDATVMRGSTLPTFDALSARATAVREEVSRFMSGSYRPRYHRTPRVSRRYLSVVYHPDVRPARRAARSQQGRGSAASKGWTVGASIAFTWDIDARLVSCAFNSCKVQMSGRSDLLLQEMSMCLRRIREDAEREGLARPTHVNVAVRRGGRFHARADFVLRGCGFMPVREYLGRIRGMVEERRREWEVVLEDVGVIDEESVEDFEMFVVECRLEGELVAIE